jgi:2-dehydro-3-deoxygluconokinase
MTKYFDVVALGEAMVEFNQGTPGEPMYRQGFGGDTSNAVIAASRQGARTAYLSRVGDDHFGRMLLDLWRDEGVDVSAVASDPQAPTGLYFVNHGPQGHAFSYLRAGSAASRMQPQTMDLRAIGDTQWLHVSGISQAISASACDTVLAAIEAARMAGAKISFDPNLRLSLWPLARARAVICATIAMSDLFLPSMDEAVALAGTEDIPQSSRGAARTAHIQLCLRPEKPAPGTRCRAPSRNWPLPIRCRRWTPPAPVTASTAACWHAWPQATR